MNHCVGGYCDRVEQGKSVIYSLRDPSNKPHVTLETEGDTFDFEQIMGNSNSDPKPEYKKIIGEWFKELISLGKNVRHYEDSDADVENYFDHIAYTDVRSEKDLETYERMYKDAVDRYFNQEVIDSYGLPVKRTNNINLLHEALIPMFHSRGS